MNSTYLGAEGNEFVCKLCKKSFFNATALLNHKSSQHDDENSDSDLELLNNQTDQIFDGLCGFKFYPLENQNEDPTTVEDNITRRTFSVDTSYIIVKIGEDDGNISKRNRLDDSVSRMQIKPKPVDLSGPFTCTLPSALQPDGQCRQIFLNCCDYSVHYRDQHTKRKKAALRCQVCEKRLERGYPSYTPEIETYTCRICGQVFLESLQLDQHTRSFHTKIKPHQCPICSKRFTQQGGLQQHMRMHSGIRPFVCVFCNKAFTQKAGLDQHLRTHTKVKPFKCVICGKCFSQSIHLRQHMRTHTNIQPFECQVCNRRFKQSSHLNFHLRSHGDVGFLMDQYQGIPQPSQLDFLNFSNVQPVKHGDTMYYAAEITPENDDISNYANSTMLHP